MNDVVAGSALHVARDRGAVQDDGVVGQTGQYAAADGRAGAQHNGLLIGDAVVGCNDTAVNRSTDQFEEAVFHRYVGGGDASGGHGRAVLHAQALPRAECRDGPGQGVEGQPIGTVASVGAADIGCNRA